MELISAEASRLWLSLFKPVSVSPASAQRYSIVCTENWEDPHQVLGSDSYFNNSINHPSKLTLIFKPSAKCTTYAVP